MASRYWEKEKPVEIDTGKNVLKFFIEAGKLQISAPFWLNANGEKKPGKTVTLDLLALKDDEKATEILRRFVA